MRFAKSSFLLPQSTNRMQAAGRTGGTDLRLKEYIGTGMRGKNAEFERELLRTVRLILKLAGVEA